MGKYSEVRIDFYDEEENKWYVDAWETDNDEEEGRVIAKIDTKGNVEYLEDYDWCDPTINAEINFFIEGELK